MLIVVVSVVVLVAILVVVFVLLWSLVSVVDSLLDNSLLSRVDVISYLLFADYWCLPVIECIVIPIINTQGFGYEVLDTRFWIVASCEFVHVYYVPF